MHYRTIAVGLSLAASAGYAQRPTPATIPSVFGAIRVERLAQQLDNPWGMSFLPDGGLLISEKPGRLRIYRNGRLSDPIAGVPRVDYLGQRGLLDVEVDPDFGRNHFIYVFYSEGASAQPAGARDPGDPRFSTFNDTTDVLLTGGAVARGRLEGNQLQDVTVIWRQVPKMIGRGHEGGRLTFAPDGRLFITSGERMRFDPAQDSTANLGKVVRINTDGSVPADNPFALRHGWRTDIYSLGHRNPLGAAIDPATGQLWINEMGPAGGDEINLIVPGRNYGWPVVSNGDNYDGSFIPDHVTSQTFERPAHSWIPSVSPSGMIFYTGSRFAGWRGQALLGGLSSMSLIRANIRDGKVTDVEVIPMGKRIRDVIQAPDGAVLLLTDGKDGELWRLTPIAR